MIIDKSLLDNLTEQAKVNPRLRQSFDLRNSAEDQSQRMLNAMEPGTVLPIHRHRNTSETVVVLRGAIRQNIYEASPLTPLLKERGIKTADPLLYGKLKEYAREMRHDQTEAESVLWNALRDNALGVKFRRQHVISDYIVDFVCLDNKLTIEVDGGYHNNLEQRLYDAMRTEEMRLRGFRELRFKNEDVMYDLSNVLNQIADALKLPLLQERVGVRLIDCIEMRPNSEIMGFSVPAGQWHRAESLESGTVILECKDGPWEPLSEEDILDI